MPRWRLGRARLPLLEACTLVRPEVVWEFWRSCVSSGGLVGVPVVLCEFRAYCIAITMLLIFTLPDMVFELRKDHFLASAFWSVP